LLLVEDEETLRGSLVLMALNAFVGAGTMVVVYLDPVRRRITKSNGFFITEIFISVVTKCFLPIF
jgi:hypothetical protein